MLCENVTLGHVRGPGQDRPDLYDTVSENIDEHEIDGEMLMKIEVP